MPTPNPGEKMSAYMQRCMSDSEMNKKHSDNKERYAICMKYWTNPPKAIRKENFEQKSIPLELKDMSHGKREIIYAHAVYNNIDHYGDVARKGMFDKSWQESKAGIGFNINHKEEGPGRTIDVWDDEQRAYTHTKIDSTKQGDDLIEMVDAGIISSASFEYKTLKRNYKTVMGRRIRELTEVRHLASTLATYDNPAVNPLTGIISMTKTQDVKNLLAEIQENIDGLEKFCREAKASDATILLILERVDELKAIFNKYAPTNAADEKEDEPDDESTHDDSALMPGHTKRDVANKLNLLIIKNFV